MSDHLVRFDWAIKKLLRSKANFGILEGFLSELLKQDLKILTILESEGNKESKDGKYNRVDVLVELASHEVVLIEVQAENASDYFFRMLYGTSKVITEYLKESESYDNIKKIYSINILYFDLGRGKDYIYHGTTSFIGVHEHDQLDLNERQQEMYQKKSVHEIYPEYYLIKVNRFNDLAKDTLDEWIYFLKNEEIKDNFRAKGLKEAKEKLDELKLSKSDRQEYRRYLEDLRYQESMVKSNYTLGKLDGKKEGREEGRAEGRAEGEEKALERVVLNLLKEKAPIEQIIKLTGLSREKIEALSRFS